MLTKYWKPAAVALALLLAFIGGRFVHPKVITKTEVTTQWKERVVTQIVEKRVEVKQEDKQAAKTIVVYRDIVTHKDGTTETKEETQERTESEDKTADAKTDDRASLTVKDAASSSHTVTTVTPVGAPRWYAGVSLGVPVGLHPVLGTPFVVVDVSYRVLGPFSLGIWGSLDIHGSNFSIGPSLGVTL